MRSPGVTSEERGGGPGYRDLPRLARGLHAVVDEAWACRLARWEAGGALGIPRAGEVWAAATSAGQIVRARVLEASGGGLNIRGAVEGGALHGRTLRSPLALWLERLR